MPTERPAPQDPQGPTPQGPTPQCHGVLAEFTSAAQIYHAAQKVRAAGYRKWDTHTPFPVHGLDKAMGLRPSILPWAVLIMGLLGAASGLGLQGWASAIAYPIFISGKAFFSWQAFIPIVFELTVLFAALGAVFGMFHLCRLPQLHHVLFVSARFAAASDHLFFVAIEAGDPKFDKDTTPRFLQQLGASHVDLLNL